jgi:hypothetical protein
VALVAISIGDPAILSGGNAAMLFGGIMAGIAASVFAWWYARRKAKMDSH